MSSKYLQRAVRIKEILTHAQSSFNAAKSYSDRVASIALSVEVINTILHTFDFAPDVYNEIDETLNNHFRSMKDEADVNRLSSIVSDVLNTLIAEAEKLEQSYREAV